MDILTILGAIGIVIGIIAGVVQVLDYLQKRRQQQKGNTSREHISLHNKEIPIAPAYLIQLRQLLTQYIDDSELQTFCFDLNVDYEGLSGQNKTDKARELVEFMQRHGRIQEVITQARHLRPHVSWTETPLAMDSGLDDLLKQTIPHNLPRRNSFVGREVEKARIHKALLEPETYLIGIDGIGGIGKSSLALAVAYDCLQVSENQDKNADIATFVGFIWASAKDREMTLNTLLDTIAVTLDYPGIVQQPLEEKRITAEKLLRSRPYLLILDKVRNFVRALPAPTKALITTREQNLNWARAISLRGLNETEALTLIRDEGQRLGLSAVIQANDQILLPLHQATDGMPLAIRWAVGQIKQKGQTLDSVLDYLRKARGNIFEGTFARSWSLLTPQARQVLMIMPLFVAPTDRAAIETVSDIKGVALDAALGQAVEMWLIEATEEIMSLYRRYSTHPLVRAYATKKLGEQESTWQEAANKRIIEHFLQFARTLINDVWGQAINKDSWALADEQFPNILLAIRKSYTKYPTKSAEFAQIMLSYLTRRGYWDEALELGINVHQASLLMIHNAQDELIQRQCSLEIGRRLVWPISWVYRHRYQLDAAEESLEEAEKIFTQLGDEKELARVWKYRGRTYQEKYHVNSDPAQLVLADQYFFKALDYYQKAGNKQANVAHTLLSLGRIAQDRQQYDKALEYVLRSLEISQEDDFIEVQGSTLITLGEIRFVQGNMMEARQHFIKALQIMDDVARSDATASARIGLAQVEEASNNKIKALGLAQKALDTFEHLGQTKEIIRAKEILKRLAV